MRRLTTPEAHNLAATLRNIHANRHMLPFGYDAKIAPLPVEAMVRHVRKHQQLPAGHAVERMLGFALYLFANELTDADAPLAELCETIRSYALFDTDPVPDTPWYTLKDKPVPDPYTTLVGQTPRVIEQVRRAASNHRLKDVTGLSHAEGATLVRLLNRLYDKTYDLDDASFVNVMLVLRTTERELYVRFLRTCRMFSHQNMSRHAPWLASSPVKEALDAAYAAATRESAH